MWHTSIRGALVRGVAGLSFAVTVTGCEQASPPSFTYYDDRIAPVIEVGCQQQTTGCHAPSRPGAAVGNLDLSSYEGLLKREDALLATGPYPVGQLLLKAGTPVEIGVQTLDPPDPDQPGRRLVVVETDIRHAGNRTLVEGSDGYATLKQWIAEGYSRSGAVDQSLSENLGECLPGPGRHPRFDPRAAPDDDRSYRAFAERVHPVLQRHCAGSSCHGTPVADLHLSCGDSERERRWNYFVATQHLDRTVSLSELLRRPLSTLRGGTFHEGGDIFASTDDEDYQALRDWAEDVVERRPDLFELGEAEEGLRFFANRVQPVLVRKGCMFLNCHSPAMFHDLRLRGGSQGTFSTLAIERNYEMARAQLAPHSPDPNDSRLIAKNLFPHDVRRGGHGISHRGGSLFEDFGDALARPERCEDVDADAGDLNEIPAYCVLVRWHELERRALLDEGDVADVTAPRLVWVQRPSGVGEMRDFDTYRPGAELLSGTLEGLDTDAPVIVPDGSVSEDCGFEADRADIRSPAVSWDGRTLAFAARFAQDEPLRLYRYELATEQCAPLADVAPGQDSERGILLHDFDPAFAPDGRIVFASTRGNLGQGQTDYEGPTRTPSTLAPNANLYVFDPDDGDIRQLTFLLNQERMPGFMADGRVIFTTEKRQPEFFQLAGRRQNLDGSDYHPLFAQRDSVGFDRATEIVEMFDRNLAMVAAPHDAADGAGTLAIVNRSIGPDQDDRDSGDPFYFSSLRLPLASALDGSRGLFRSPVPLPGGRLLASCDLDARDVGAGDFDFDLCVVDVRRGEVVEVGGAAGLADVQPALIWARTPTPIFDARIDEANGTTRLVEGEQDGQVHYLDFPLLGSLLFANTREGRPINPDVGGFEVLEVRPPPADALDFDDLPGADVVSDAYGRMHSVLRNLGAVPLFDDGSAKVRVPGGTPLLLRLTDRTGEALQFEEDGPFTGEQIQREQFQLYPGERLNQGFPGPLFDGMCGGCHGSVSGEELDVAVDVDALTSASRTDAADGPPRNPR